MPWCHSLHWLAFLLHSNECENVHILLQRHDAFLSQTVRVKVGGLWVGGESCEKDVGVAETERGSDRDGWSGQQRCAFLSVFTIYVYMYLYHIVSLSGLTQTHIRSLILMELREENDSQASLLRPSPVVPCFLSASLTTRPLRDPRPTHTYTQRWLEIYVYSPHAEHCTHAAVFKYGQILTQGAVIRATGSPAARLFSTAGKRVGHGVLIKECGGGDREAGEALDPECFCVVSRNILLCMQRFPWCCCGVERVCLCECVRSLSPLNVFGLTCPQGWIKPVKVLRVCVCVWCSEMY